MKRAALLCEKIVIYNYDPNNEWEAALNDVPREVCSQGLTIEVDDESFFENLSSIAVPFLVRDAVPVFDDEDDLLRFLPKGASPVLCAVADNIPAIVEAGATWEQVVQFRRDVAAIRKYRNLRLWLLDLGQSRDLDEFSDRIAQRLSEYEWSLAKHGFETRMELVTEILSQTGSGSGLEK